MMVQEGPLSPGRVPELPKKRVPKCLEGLESVKCTNVQICYFECSVLLLFYGCITVNVDHY